MRRRRLDLEHTGYISFRSAERKKSVRYIAQILHSKCGFYFIARCILCATAFVLPSSCIHEMYLWTDSREIGHRKTCAASTLWRLEKGYRTFQEVFITTVTMEKVVHIDIATETVFFFIFLSVRKSEKCNMHNLFFFFF